MILLGLLAAPSIHVGSLTLHECPGDPGYYCGSIVRPLDPSGAVPGTTPVGFTFVHHSKPGLPIGTIVAAEGGPGYPSGGSRDSYRKLFAPLLNSYDLLMMDQRGTGRSGVIDCEPLQSDAVVMLPDVTKCGQRLGKRAAFYGSAFAADDLRAVLDELGVQQIALYGDSYGTFFSQVFAALHPTRVRLLVLDGAYPARGESPWYPAIGRTMREAFDRVCRRDAACAALPGTTNQRIAALVAKARRTGAPFTATQLAMVMYSAGLGSIAYRELDAAARAYVQNDDPVPAQRLVREAYDFEARDTSGLAGHSQGLFVATSCQDNSQAYDMRLAPAAREKEYHAALARENALEPGLYAPFTLEEFMNAPLDFSYVPLCQTWPIAPARYPASMPIPPGTPMPDVPALVLTGDLDTITTPTEGNTVASFFPRATRVIVPNTTHVTAMGDIDDCASVIVRAFVAGEKPDAHCVSGVPPLHVLPQFARTSAQLKPALASEGNTATPEQMKEATSAAYAAADALVRADAFGETSGKGLRGGKFSAGTKAHIMRVTLDGVRWASDIPVSGTVAFDTRHFTAHAVLRLPAGATLDATWKTHGPSTAMLAGTFGAQTLRATMPAP